jgi:hypothetical protein
MLFYKIINKITQDKYEINKVFYSELNAFRYSEYLNDIHGLKEVYIPNPFIYIMSEEEREMYNIFFKKRKKPYL